MYGVLCEILCTSGVYVTVRTCCSLLDIGNAEDQLDLWTTRNRPSIILIHQRYFKSQEASYKVLMRSTRGSKLYYIGSQSWEGILRRGRGDENK